jgi:hypothetical protein
VLLSGQSQAPGFEAALGDAASFANLSPFSHAVPSRVCPLICTAGAKVCLLHRFILDLFAATS